jgi:hypothetical protein
LLVALYSAARACHEAKLFIVCCPGLKDGLMRPINHKLPVYTSAVPPTFRRQLTAQHALERTPKRF